MRKSLAALAALAFVGGASAQSSVTMFGVVDTGISNFSNKTENALGRGFTTSQTILNNSGYNTSRLGFRGTEDLGGGLAASFWLEAGILTDTGAGVNNPPFASPSFWNDSVFDPFNFANHSVEEFGEGQLLGRCIAAVSSRAVHQSLAQMLAEST